MGKARTGEISLFALMAEAVFEIGFAHGAGENLHDLINIFARMGGHDLEAKARTALRHRGILYQIGDAPHRGKVARGKAAHGLGTDAHRNNG